MNLPVISLKTSIHKQSEVVQLHFKKDEKLLQLLRVNKDLRWSKTMGCWYLPYRSSIKNDLFLCVRGVAWLDYKDLIMDLEPEPFLPLVGSGIQSKKESVLVCTLQQLNTEAERKLREFTSWLRSKRYSESTIGTYSDTLKTFLRFYHDKAVCEITNKDVIEFNNEYILKNNLSASFQNQVVNAIKLFFRTIELKSLEVDLIHRPKRGHPLPNVLSKEEVKAILGAHNNIKHKTMLSLIYSCGLRCGELLKLKPEHIDSKRGLVIIKQAKGKKDRVIPLSAKILLLLREYYLACKPIHWLFEGQSKGEPYDERSLQAVLKQALAKGKIEKPVTLHWLRHSYATHLLESGTDLRYIQELLGHSRSTTTEIYTHVSNKDLQKISSPFDTL